MSLLRPEACPSWLKHLENTPLYKYANVKIDWSRLTQFDGDDHAEACEDDGEIEVLPEITDLDDAVQAVLALNSMSQTLLYDDAVPHGGRRRGGEKITKKLMTKLRRDSNERTVCTLLRVRTRCRSHFFATLMARNWRFQPSTWVYLVRSLALV